MCGIVGAATQRNVQKILIEGLRRLEYRGYDSAGLSIIDDSQQLQTRKVIGKVIGLETIVSRKMPLSVIRVLRTLVGRPTASQVPKILIHTTQLAYRLCIMASLKIMTSCGQRLLLLDTKSVLKLTAK